MFVREHAKAVGRYDDIVVLHAAGKDPNLKETWRLKLEEDPALTEGIATWRLWHRASPVPKTSYAFYLASAFAAYRRLLATGFRPDVIHAHVFEAGLPAVLLGRRYGIPVVITEHDSDFPRRRLARAAVWRARVAFALAHRVLPVSQALQRGIQAYGIRGRFQVVPNVVDTERFLPPAKTLREPQPLRLLFVGSLIPVKGLSVLLTALSRLGWPPGTWRLDVIGDGSERAACEQQAVESGLGTQIVFHGVQTKAVVADFMQRADLLVLPSLWDNAPCVLIEAMACGLPILATQVGGIPEIVDEAVGCLVPPDDSAALADALARMLNILPSYDRRDIAARATRYSPTEVGRALHAIYVECLRR